MNNTVDNNKSDWKNIDKIFAGSSNPTEDGIDFEPINEPKYPDPIASQYDSIYDELLAKCDISNFENEPERQKRANSIFAHLLKCSKEDCPSIISIRNEAIDNLGINISTDEKYNLLLEYFDSEQYKNPYDEELIAQAIDLKEQTKRNADDIRRLEQIEKDAKPFILKREIYFAKKSIQYGDINTVKHHCGEATNINKELGVDSCIKNQIEEIESEINRIEAEALRKMADEEKKDRLNIIILALVIASIFLIVLIVGMNK